MPKSAVPGPTNKTRLGVVHLAGPHELAQLLRVVERKPAAVRFGLAIK